MVPKLGDHLHIGEHDDAKPEDGDDTQADIRYVDEHILIHNSTSVSNSLFESLY